MCLCLHFSLGEMTQGKEQRSNAALFRPVHSHELVDLFASTLGGLPH
jgi:hypothetical protein